MSLSSRIEPLWAAFSFLTRLAPARVFADAVLAASPPWYPLTGLVLGALACLPALTGLARPWPGLQAVMYLAVMFWATRGLHWDGLADCADAWGSGKRGEAFQAILKDSRIGAFGTLGIVFLFAFQWVCLSAHFSAPAPQTWALLILAPALGRAAMLIPPLYAPPHPVSTLGRAVAPGCTLPPALGWTAVLLAAFAATQGPRAFAALAALLLLALIPLCRLARREGGFNGDVLGCACMLAESAALAAPLL